MTLPTGGWGQDDVWAYLSTSGCVAMPYVWVGSVSSKYGNCNNCTSSYFSNSLKLTVVCPSAQPNTSPSCLFLPYSDSLPPGVSPTPTPTSPTTPTPIKTPTPTRTPTPTPAPVPQSPVPVPQAPKAPVPVPQAPVPVPQAPKAPAPVPQAPNAPVPVPQSPVPVPQAPQAPVPVPQAPKAPVPVPQSPVPVPQAPKAPVPAPQAPIVPVSSSGLSGPSQATTGQKFNTTLSKTIASQQHAYCGMMAKPNSWPPSFLETHQDFPTGTDVQIQWTAPSVNGTFFIQCFSARSLWSKKASLRFDVVARSGARLEETETQEAEDGLAPWAIGVIVAAVLGILLVVLLVAFVVTRKQHQEKP